MLPMETVKRIRDRYPWASWAIWDDKFPDEDCVENTPDDVADFLINHSDQLTTDIIMLGLNRSEDLPAPFVNFHSPSGTHYDNRLKEFIQDGKLTRLQGAYMTDLVDEIDPDSSSVTVTEDDAQVLEKQLELLGEHEYHVICFGNKPFQGLTDYYGVDYSSIAPEIRYAATEIEGIDLHLYRVWFYGLYGIYQSKVETLEKQLHRINEMIN